MIFKIFFRSVQRKRPDIPIYVPKALRGSAISTVPNNCATSSSNCTLPSKAKHNSVVQNNSSNKYVSKESNGMLSALNLTIQHDNCVLKSLNSFKFLDLTNEMSTDNINNEFNMSFNEVSYQIPESSNNLPDFLNTNNCKPNSSISNEKIKSHILEPLITGTTLNNCDNISLISNLPQCLSNNDNRNYASINLPDLTKIEQQETIAENVLESQEIKNSDLDVVGNIGRTVNKNIKNVSDSQQCEMHLGNSNVNDNTLEMKLTTEHMTSCPYYRADDNFNSETSVNIENNCNEELIPQKPSKLINKSTEIIGHDEQKVQKINKEKQVLDVDECCWEDLYDKEDDYIHPLLMKEVSYFYLFY